MKLKQDMRDLGIYYLGGILNKDKNDNWWMRNKEGTYEPPMQLITGSLWFGIVAFILFVGIIYLRFG